MAATGLRGDTSVEVDGNEQSLRDAPPCVLRLCRVTPNLLRFVAESCGDTAAAKSLRASLEKKDKLDKWLVNRNGLDIVGEFAVAPSPSSGRRVLERLTPRSYSISSSPLVRPHEVQLTVSVCATAAPTVASAAGCARRSWPTEPPPRRCFLQRSPHFRPPEDGGTPMIMVGPGTRHRCRFAAFCRSDARSATPAATGCSFTATSTAAKNFYLPRRFG